MLAVIRCYHEGMRASIRADNDQRFWSGVGQDLRLICVLAPLLFNMFFTAVLRMVLEQFSANADVVKNTVYTKVKDEKAG